MGVYMKNVLLVFGGKSYEHDISIVTASQIFNRTQIDDVKLIPLYISRDNRMFIYMKSKLELNDFSVKKGALDKKIFKEIVFVSSENNIIFQKSRFGLKEFLRVDHAVIACHGGDGENGKLAAKLESYGLSLRNDEE